MKRAWIWLAVALVLGAVEREGWRLQMAVPGVAGDALQYYRLARNLAATRTLAFDEGVPEWTRLPGYPVALWALGAPDESDHVAFKNWLVRAQRLNLALDLALAVLVMLLGEALGAGRWALLGAVAWIVQPWATLAATIPLADVSATFVTLACLTALAWAMAKGGGRRFAVAGGLAAAAQYIRGDALLLVPVVVGGALLVGSWRAAAPALAVYLLLFAAWPIRNLIRFGEPHWLGGGTNIDARGGSFDRSAVMSWMRTWAASEQATVEVGWRIPFRSLTVAQLPPAAVDSLEESSELRLILRRYNSLGGRFDDELRTRLSKLAADKAARHPFRTYLILPLERMLLMLLPPRDHFGLGPLPVLEAWRPLYTAGDAALVLAALLAWWRLRGKPIALALGGFVALRLALMGWLPTPEPRYFLPALPVLFALASALPSLLTEKWRSARE